MPDNGMFVVKYFEIVGSDPARIVAACDTLGIRATELGPAVALPAAPAAAAAPPPPKKRDTMPPKETPEDEPPRRRGRPPSREDVPESESQKPRRGRPRKSDPAEDAEAPKRGRGRPRKNRDEDPPPKRRSAEPPPDDDAGEDDDADVNPTYADIIGHLKAQDPRRIGDIVEELYLEFGWNNSRDMAQVLKSVRADTKLSSHDFWAVLERICPDGEEDDWLNLLDDRIKPHLEDAIGAADDAGNG